MKKKPKKVKAYSPAYFRRLADDYQHLSETARDFNVPDLLCCRLMGAAIQLRYAADAIEAAAALGKATR